MENKPVSKKDGRTRNGGLNKWSPTDSHLALIEKLSGLGLRLEDIAHCLDIHPNTLDLAKKRDERIACAYKKGRAQAFSAVAESLYNQAMNGNITAAIFYLKAQAGWAERTEIDIGHKLRPIVIEGTTGEKVTLTYEETDGES